MRKIKELIWIGSALEELKTFPDEVKDEVGYSLHRVQEGKQAPNAKHLTGLGAMEIISDYDTNTYRAVYTVNLGEKIYVIHCFQKKSKRGIKTPKEEIQVIKQRIKWLKKELSKQRG